MTSAENRVCHGNLEAGGFGFRLAPTSALGWLTHDYRQWLEKKNELRFRQRVLRNDTDHPQRPVLNFCYSKTVRV